MGNAEPRKCWKRRQIFSEITSDQGGNDEAEKKKKAALQKELLHVQIYITQLEALKLQKKLGLTRLEFTIGLQNISNPSNADKQIYYVLNNNENGFLKIMCKLLKFSFWCYVEKNK